MIYKLLLINEYKALKRSSFWRYTLVTSIIFSIFIVFWLLIFAMLGFALPSIIRSAYQENFIVLLNRNKIPYILLDLVSRFFFQRLPTALILPYLTLPVPKKKLINLFLFKHQLFFGNLLIICFFLPFTLKSFESPINAYGFLIMALCTLIINGYFILFLKTITWKRYWLKYFLLITALFSIYLYCIFHIQIGEISVSNYSDIFCFLLILATTIISYYLSMSYVENEMKNINF